jgi:hypothetical protein
MDSELIPFGEATTRLRCQWHHVARLARQKQIPFVQAGHVRLVRVVDLDKIREVLVERGYLRDGLVTC